MAAQEAIAQRQDRHEQRQLFWLDPWSAQGQDVSAKLLPQAHDLRLHAERAIVLLAQARADNPKLAEPDALAAMDLGARRLDLIGLKFELAAGDRRCLRAGRRRSSTTRRSASAAQPHARARSAATMAAARTCATRYSALKAEYSQVWLGENRPYWLNNVTVRYDLEIERWQRRGNQFETAIRAWHERPGSARGLRRSGLPAAAAAASLPRVRLKARTKTRIESKASGIRLPV